MGLNKTQAASIIEEHFRALRHKKRQEDVLVSARVTGRKMVEIYRLLTGEMPQAVGIEAEYHGDEIPGVEFSSPIGRTQQVIEALALGQGSNSQGDQHGERSTGTTLRPDRKRGG